MTDRTPERLMPIPAEDLAKAAHIRREAAGQNLLEMTEDELEQFFLSHEDCRKPLSDLWATYGSHIEDLLRPT